MIISLGIGVAFSESKKNQSHEAALDPDIIELLSKAGFGIEPLTGISHTGNKILVGGLSFIASEQQAEKFIDEYYKKFKARGYYVFRQERGYNYISDRVGIIKSTDQFDILRIRKTHAYTHNLSTLQIIEKLKQWNNRYGIDLIGAGYNWLNFRFNKTPENMSAFANEVLDFCPDVLLFSAGTVDQLQQSIKTDRALFLQWN